MSTTEVILEDGHVCYVSRLPIFALDKLEVDILGPYTYEVEFLTGRKEQVVYDGSAWKEPPPMPDLDGRHPGEIDPASPVWYELREHQLYQAWLRHEEKREQSMFDYCHRCAWYILVNCIKDEDIAHIVTAADWEKVHQAALVPEVQPEDLAAVLRQTFQGDVRWDGDIRRDGQGERR